MIAWLLGLAALPAILQLAELGRILWSRFDYPYDAHWMEGGSLLHAYRLLTGQPVYPEPTPSAGFLPFTYAPFLYVTLAVAGSIGGLDYVTGRAISLFAVAVAGTVLAHQVYVRFRDLRVPWVWALLTFGAIAAGFPITGGWYDAIMPDPLALGLAVVSGRMLLTDSNELGVARLGLASGLMVLTIFTKQTYLVLVVWQILFVCLSSVRRGLALGLATAASTAVALGAGQYLTQGHFLYYAGGQVLRHGTEYQRIWHGIGVVSSFAPYLPLVVMGVVFLAFKRALSLSALMWAGMLVAALPMALRTYAKWGSWDNVFLPIVVLAPAAALCVLADLCRWLKPDARAIVLLPCALGAAFYLLVRRYSPEPYLATDERRVAATTLNEFVAGLGGDVLIPARPFLAIRHGTPIEQIHIMGWFDALFAGRKLSFDDFVRRTRPRYVLLSDQEPAVIVEALANGYFLGGPMPVETWPAQTLERREVDRKAVESDYPGRLHWLLERNPAEPPTSRCLFEFESSAYDDGWTVKGDAYASGPTRVDAQRGTLLLATQGTVLGVVGRSFSSSYSTKQASGALGVLRSPPFTLDSENLELRVAGGTSERTRVELRVDGRARYRASGRGNNYLEQVRWNVAKYRGRSGQLVIIDKDKAGHILVDHVCLVDRP